jgi:hypothetical protein
LLMISQTSALGQFQPVEPAPRREPAAQEP